MDTIHFTAIVPEDRLLCVRVPEHIKEHEVEVTVLLESRSGVPGPRVSAAQWAAIVQDTAGALSEAPLDPPADPAPEPVEDLP